MQPRGRPLLCVCQLNPHDMKLNFAVHGTNLGSLTKGGRSASKDSPSAVWQYVMKSAQFRTNSEAVEQLPPQQPNLGTAAHMDGR